MSELLCVAMVAAGGGVSVAQAALAGRVVRWGPAGPLELAVADGTDGVPKSPPADTSTLEGTFLRALSGACVAKARTWFRVVEILLAVAFLRLYKGRGEATPDQDVVAARRARPDSGARWRRSLFRAAPVERRSSWRLRKPSA